MYVAMMYTFEKLNNKYKIILSAVSYTYKIFN